MHAARAPIERWSRSKLEDRFHSVFDEVQTLKQSNQQMKREMKIMNGRIGAGRITGIDTQRDRSNQESMMDELRRSNQVLSQKLEVLKHQLLNYTAINSRIRPSRVGSRPSMGQSKIGNGKVQPGAQNRTQGGMMASSSTAEKRPQSATMIGTNGGRNARNQRIRQRTMPTSAGTTVKNEGNWQDKDLMAEDEFSPEKRTKILENGESRIGRQKSNDWVEIVQLPVQSGSEFNNHFNEITDEGTKNLQRQNRMALAENEELRLSLEKNEQRLTTLCREYDLIVAELEETQKELRTQSESISSYREEAQRKTETSSKSAEISDKELAILREECRSLKAAYDSLVTRSLEEENGSKKAMDELTRLRIQIQQSSSENESERREWEEMLRKLRDENERLERELKKIEMSGRSNREKGDNEFRVDENEGGEKGPKMVRNENSDGNQQNVQNPIENGHQVSANLTKNLGHTNGEEMLDKLFNDVIGIVYSHIGQRNEKIGPIDNDEHNRWQKMYEDVYEELERVRRLLLSEHRINAGIKEQIEQMALENENLRRKYAQDLEEMRKEFEERGIRMGQLERELEMVAVSGQIREAFLANEKSTANGRPEIESTQLSLFISKLTLTKFGIDHFVGQSPQLGPTLFVAIEFFDFELQTSKLASGPEADLNFNAIFELTVSDLFIHYLQTEGINVELYTLKEGPIYELLSQSQIPLRKFLSTQTPTQFRGEVNFPMFQNEGQPPAAAEKSSQILAKLAYTIQVPFTLLRALSAQRRRMAATSLLPLDGGDEGKNDELTIQIHRCNGLDKLKGGQWEEGRNSSAAAGGIYVAYEFFTFPVHMSKIAANTGNPIFDESHSWKLPAGSEAVNKYLREKDLLIYIIQEAFNRQNKIGSDSQPSASNSRALAFIRLPLFPLSQNGKISGTFTLCDRADESIAAGASIDMSIFWKFAYLFERQQQNSELEQKKFAIPLTKKVAAISNELEERKIISQQQIGPIQNEKIKKTAASPSAELAIEKQKSLEESEEDEEMSEIELRRRLFVGFEEPRQNVAKLEGKYLELKKAVELEKNEMELKNLKEIGQKRREDENVEGREEYSKVNFEEFELKRDKLEAEIEKATHEAKNSSSESQISGPENVHSPKSSTSSGNNEKMEEEELENEDEEGSVKSDVTYTMETIGERENGDEGIPDVVIRDEDILAKEELRKAVRRTEEEKIMDAQEKPPFKPKPSVRHSLLGDLPPIQQRPQIRNEPAESSTESFQQQEIAKEPSSTGKKAVEFTEPLHSSIPPSEISASFAEDLLSSHSNASAESNENDFGDSPDSPEDLSTPKGKKDEEGQMEVEKQQRRTRKWKQRRQINIDAMPKSPAIRAHPKEESFESMTSNGENQQLDGDNGQQRAIVQIHIGKLRLLEHSSLLHPEYNAAHVYVEWNFLDIEREFCETEGTMLLPRHSSEPIEFNQQKEYKLNHKRVALLKQWTELNIRLSFTLVLEPASKGQQESDDLCMGELDLIEVLNANDHTLIMRNVDNVAIAVLEVEVEYSDRLMQEIRDAIDAADDGIVEV